MKKIVEKIIRTTTPLLQLQLPIIRNTVLFRSFYGQYNDNPKYISEELHRRFPDMRIIWAIRDGKKEEFPSYVELVPLETSVDYFKYISRAQIVIDNYYGCRSYVVENRNYLKRIIGVWRSRQRKGQFCLSTWHGTPLKHIALDEPQYQGRNEVKIYPSTDVLLAGARLTADAFRTALKWKKEIAMYGTPRNDILFQHDESFQKKMKEKLGLPADKKVVLFAPTFRDSVEMSGLYQIKELDIPRLCKVLEERFGGEWCFVFRSHNEVMKRVAERGETSEHIINGNQHSDMAEYLVACDALITDYSGSMFDYALTPKPCFLYTPDLEHYAGTERGFYLDIHSLPFPIAENTEELLDQIAAFQYESYQKAVDEMLIQIGNVEDGNAARRVVDRIAEYLSASQK